MKRIALLVALLSVAFACGAAAEDKTPAYTFTWSGYIKADFAYDRARVTSGDYALYVLESDPGAENDLMSITARESRLGFDFGWIEGEYKTAAKVEFDFYGLGASSASLTAQENKATTMLRHAYVEVAKGRWSLLAGQTSDVMSPLVPKTVNYTVCWDQGNIGYRRPQLRLSTSAKVKDHGKVSFAVAAARTIGGDIDGDDVDDGADSALPTIEGRLGLAAKTCSRGTIDIGVSGHYGRETYDGDEEKIESWSANGDFKAVFCAKLEVSGELFVGQNLGAYYGGVGQTVNPLGCEIGSKGGWAQVSFSPTPRFSFNAGYGIDDPDEEDLEIDEGGAAKSFIDANENIFGSVFYSITSNVQAMFEVSRMTTSYLRLEYEDESLVTGSREFDDLRVQFALKAAIK